ncbi:MAG: LON peptidase substrate-binding domain-containing protein [Leptospiraceae bacterium]|nr:LON peptidase substrate-binding domain-containing protein [Leptospiraceae bacterium]
MDSSHNLVAVFPLGTVLLPGMPLPLHIFEPRYRTMMEEVLAGLPLAIFSIEEGQEALGSLARPAHTGTLIRLDSVEKLNDGRMNLLVTGTHRLRWQELVSEDPFLKARLSVWEDEDAGQNEKEKRRLAVALHSELSDYLALLQVKTRVELPEEPELICHLCIQNSGLPLPRRQAFLEIPTLQERMERTLRMMQRKNLLIRSSPGPGIQQGESLN